MITISRARQDEILRVKELLSATWIDTYGAFLPEDVIAAVTSAWHHPDRLRAEAERPDVYFGLAKAEDGDLVGLVTLRRHERDALGFLSRLYVHPAHQRRGIGARLLQAAIAASPGITRLRLEVEAQNFKGRAFYAKQGFRQVGTWHEEVSGIVLETLVLEKDVGC